MQGFSVSSEPLKPLEKKGKTLKKARNSLKSKNARKSKKAGKRRSGKIFFIFSAQVRGRGSPGRKGGGVSY